MSRPALDGISLWIAPGERVCLVGESGAGKTSLLRVVAGLAAPSAGRSRLVGTGLGPGSRPVLGWVPQHPTILDATILDNIALGRPGIAEPAVCAALAAVQLGPWLRARPAGLRTPLHGLDAPLSLGERRRLAVARCLAGPRPRLWLLDEPTAGLDRASAERLVAELSRIVVGVTAIVATHDPAAMTLGQRTVELGHGRVLGPAAGILPGRPGTRLGGERPVTRRPAASGRRPGLDGPARHRALAAAGIGVAGELGAIGLLATGAWLLLSASFRPPVLLLSVAIGAVQLFAFLRGSARYGERLASHNLGLSLQAALRAWLYGRLERLVPAGLPGGDRGDLLARLVSDTEEAQDLVVRAAVPVLVGAVAWGAAVVTAGLLLGTAGWVLLTAGVLGAAGVAAAVAAGAPPGGGPARRPGAP